MVISNVELRDPLDISIRSDELKDSVTKWGENDQAADEWKMAVETVLPHLLGHGLKKRKAETSELEQVVDENGAHKTYFDAVFEFGRWVGSIGNYFRRNRFKTKIRKPEADLSTHLSFLKDFLILLENVQIKRFLDQDKCKIFSDSYLLAMVFTYFLRARFASKEYNIQNFYVALVLANEMEEENYAVDVLVVELETAALQVMDDDKEFIPINRLRYELFVRMDYRALVSRKCCEEIMALYPEHWAWKRKRYEHHSGVYQYKRNPMQRYSYDYMQWTSVHNMFFQACEPCLKLEKMNTVLAATKEKKTGKRLSLKKRAKN